MRFSCQIKHRPQIRPGKDRTVRNRHDRTRPPSVTRDGTTRKHGNHGARYRPHPAGAGEEVSLLVRLGLRPGERLEAELRPVRVPEAGLEVVLLLIDSPGFALRSPERTVVRVSPRRTQTGPRSAGCGLAGGLNWSLTGCQRPRYPSRTQPRGA